MDWPYYLRKYLTNKSNYIPGSAQLPLNPIRNGVWGRTCFRENKVELKYNPIRILIVASVNDQNV
jgi:hypothetical protein